MSGLDRLLWPPYARALRWTVRALGVVLLATLAHRYYQAGRERTQACAVAYLHAVKPMLRDRVVRPADPCLALREFSR